MFRKFVLIIFSILFLKSQAMGQCPSIDFTVADTVCLNENISVINNSLNTDSVIWDFCSGDLLGSTSTALLSYVNGLTNARNLNLVNTPGGWYGFSMSITDNSLFRLSFGNDLSSVPTAENLGNIDNKFNRPVPIVFTRYNGNWYAFVFNGGVPGIVRLDFGNDLGNTPVASDVISPVGGDFTNMDIGLDSGNYFLVLSNYGTSTISIVKLGNSPANIPQPSDVFTTSAVSGANFLDIKLYKDCGTWTGFAAGYGNKKIYRLDFTNGLGNLPDIHEITGFDFGTELPTRLEIRQELGKYLCFVTTEPGNLYRGVIGESIGNNALQSFDSLGNVSGNSNTYGFTVSHSGSRWFGFSMTSNGALYRADFPDNCGASVPESSGFEPQGIYYNAPGKYYITSYGYNMNRDFKTGYDSIVIKNSTPPPVSFTTANACLSNPNSFVAVSPGDSIISSYNWDFGNGDSATGTGVNYQYTVAGVYKVNLNISTTDGCTNEFSDSVALYESPVASFDLPVSNLCANALLTFNNTSSGLNSDSIRFSWNYNDEGTSFDSTGIFTFNAGGTKNITLKAEITGCTDSITQQINLDNGPAADYTWLNNCWDEASGSSTPQFINYSDSVDVNYLWDLGDGSPGDTSRSPGHSYGSAGKFNVILEVQNTVNGCLSTISDSINISDSPLATYTYDTGPVENIPVGFYGQDLTGNRDSIESWVWNFDTLASATGMNPVYSFPEPGTYNVKLSFTSSQRCVSDTIQQVVIAKSKCPEISFTVPDSVCRYERIITENHSLNAVKYEWDLCAGDLLKDPVAVLSASAPGITNARTLAIVRSSSGWYGFFLSITDNLLFRVNFGDSLSSVPVIENMGNIGNKFNRPVSIVFKEYNRNWYAFVFNGGDPGIIRLDFGNDLTNTPVATDVISPVGGDFTNMDIGSDSGKYYLVLSNYSTNDLKVIDLGNSPLDIPDTTGIITSPAISGAGLLDVKLFRNCNSWFGFALGYVNRKVYRLDFNNGLGNLPDIHELSGFNFDTDLPTRISIQQELGKYLCFVTGVSGNLYCGIIGDNIQRDSIELFRNLGNFSDNNSIFGLAVTRSASKSYAFCLTSNGSIYRADFPDNCTANIPFTTDDQPAQISYSSSGTYYITCTGLDVENHYQLAYDSIFVKNSESQTISFSTQNACLNNSNSFTAASPADSLISSWTWDFGDGSPEASGQNVSHQFDSAGTYPVKLSVKSQNGCSNFSLQSVPVYQPPEPDFTVSPSLLCVNSDLDFGNNTITTAPDSLISYQWDFDGEAVSTIKDTFYNFTSTGIKNVRLTASIPGCSIDTVKSIDVKDSPQSDFTFENECNGIPVTFQNTTGGAFVQSDWDFGDGNTSTSSDPVHMFDTTGIFPVKLTVTNSLGCDNTRYDTVTIYHYPVAGFQYELPCAGSSVTFYDTSSVTGANITKYDWEMSDPLAQDSLQISVDRDPAFTAVQPGQHLVRLRVESNYGCADSVSHQLEFLPAPVADFTFEDQCFGDSVLFRDMSTVQDSLTITQWTWEIDSNVLTTKDAGYLFKTPGVFPVTLMVKASNLCTDQIQKTTLVKPPPVAGIIAGNSCLNQTSVFRDNSVSQADPITGYNWQIGDNTYPGTEVSMQFDSTGRYVISHWVTTAANCTDSIADTITIYPVPRAEFSMTPPTGSPPLSVEFTNKSAGADNYQWRFGDSGETINQETDPTHIYSEPGIYTVNLLAINDSGCMDSTFKNLNVVKPVYDVTLRKVKAFENNGATRFILDIENNGSVIIDNMNIVISINNEYRLTESFNNVLYAGDTAEHLLNFEFLHESSSRPSYICFKLEPLVKGQTEVNLANNTECYSPVQKFSSIDPYPNPVSGELTVPFILPEPSNVEITLLSSEGMIVFNKILQNGKAGYNEVHLNMDLYNPGMYVLIISGKDGKATRKIFVSK